MSTSASALTIYTGSALAIALSAALAYDHYRELPEPSWPLVSGTVVERTYERVFLVLRRPRLAIKIEPDGPLVHAVLMTNASSDIPDRVTFRFGGQADEEVVLAEESSSLFGAALGTGAALFLLAVWPWYQRSQRAVGQRQNERDA